MLRNDSKYPDTWGLPGGKIEQSESLLDGIIRECTEELGSMPEYIKLIPIEKFTSPDFKFSYHTFFCLVNDEFMPTLNYEHRGFAWIDSGVWPKPMHPGLWQTVNIEEIQNKISSIVN